MFVSLAILALVASVSAKDLTVGQGGEIIFHENITESPTIWKRVENVTVEAPAEITQIIVIDHRDDKNGEADIVEGGVGYTNVTIELKGPSVFRGLYFEIQVYAKPINGVQILDNSASVQDTNEAQEHQDRINVHPASDATSTTPKLSVIQETEQHPVETDKGLPIPVEIQSTIQTPAGQDKVQLPVEIGKDMVTPIPVITTSQLPVVHEAVNKPVETVTHNHQVHPSHQIPLNPLFKDFQSTESTEKLEQVKQTKA